MKLNKEKVSERMRKIGSKGGKSTAQRYGSEYMRKIGKKGGKKTWRGK